MYTVLIVDDEELVAQLYGKIVERLSHRPIITYSGDECLQVLKSERPDLILLDILMEPMDGWITLTEIRANPDTEDIPVVMVTGKPLTPIEVVKYGMLIDGYVMKPFVIDKFSSVIQMVVGRSAEHEAALKEALDAGADRDTATEYATLQHRIVILKELWKLVQKHYHFFDSEEMDGDMQELEGYIAEKEHRLAELKHQLGIA